MTRVFINGFGRIGRTVLRAWTSGAWPDLQIIGINDIAAPDLCAHLFEYDSVFGPFAGDVRLDDTMLYINGTAIPMHHTADVSMLNLMGVDLFLEFKDCFDANNTFQPCIIPRDKIRAMLYSRWNSFSRKSRIY